MNNVEQQQEEQLKEVIIQPVVPVEATKSGWVGFINRPWILLTIPVLAGAFWLVNNTWVITNNLDKPYMLLAGPATAGSVAGLWVLAIFFKAIVAAIKNIWSATVSYVKKPGSALWIGTISFLTVSVTEGSTVFNELFANNLGGILGYAAASSIDVVSVICILARQNASRRNDEQGKKLFMIGLIACAAASTIANGYATFEHYKAPHDVVGTLWVLGAYALGTIPPLLIVFLGFASDYISDQASSTLDPEAFAESEKSRIRFRQIQLETLKEKQKIQDEIEKLNGTADKKAMKQAKAVRPRVPLIAINFRKPKDPEPLDYDKLVALLVPVIVEKVKPDPVNYAQIRATVVNDLKPLLPKSVPPVEPLNVDDLLQKLTPMVAQTVMPEPLDYERLAQSIAPHFAGQMRTIRATLIEEVKSFVPQIAEAKKTVVPQVEANKKQKLSHVRAPRETSLEERLEVALQGFLSQGKEVSGRGLSELTGCNRNKATAWLKSNHPEYIKTKLSGTNQPDGTDDATQFDGTVEDNSGEDITEDNNVSDGDEMPAIIEEIVPDKNVSEDENDEPHSDEMPAIIIEVEPVLVD